MPVPRVRSLLVLAAVPLLVATLPSPAQAAPAPTPPAPPRQELPEGPWPPDEILAADPADVPVPAGTADAALAAAAGQTVRCPAAPFGVQRTAPGSGRTVALTFDDGPGTTTAAILSILQRYGVAATFLNIGVNASVRPSLVRFQLLPGYAVGNHSWSHPQMPTLSAAGQAAEMDRTSALQNAQLAVAPCLFRPPYGEYDGTTLSLAQQRRMSVWNWSVDTEDWKAGTSTSSAWVERIVSRAVAGGSQAHPVILMHNPPAGIPATVTALPRIIEFYRSHGYRFVDLLGDAAGRAPTPAAATTSSGLHLYARSSTATVVERTLSGGTWSGWRQLGGSVVGGPAAVATSATTTTLVAAAGANAVYTSSVPDVGATGGWGSLGGVTTTRPSIAVAPNGVQAVVVRGGDGRVYLRQRVSGQWTGWQSLGGLLAPLAPAAAFTISGALTVAVVAANRAMYVRTRTATGAWSGWRSLGGSINSDLALSPTADRSRLVAAARGGTTGYAGVFSPGGTGWSGWRSLGGNLASGPGLTRNGAAVEAFVVGGDNRYYRNTATDGTQVSGWTGWRILP
jgi:peptidoglycan/xylan/chitin deacetylase (PgdA/CDA1 family)